MKVADLKDVVTIIQSLITAAAIIVGGIWSYLLFVRKRQKYPRAKLEHRIVHWAVDKDTVLVSIDIIIFNTSDVLLSLVSGKIDVHQVLPPENKFLQMLNEVKPMMSQRIEDIHWPSLFSYKEHWEKQVVEIEPGESEQLHYTLLLSSEVHMIHVESFFRNIAKRRRLEWGLETFHDMQPESCPDNVLPV